MYRNNLRIVSLREIQLSEVFSSDNRLCFDYRNWQSMDSRVINSLHLHSSTIITR